jgi:hypothetical protein
LPPTIKPSDKVVPLPNTPTIHQWCDDDAGRRPGSS